MPQCQCARVCIRINNVLCCLIQSLGLFAGQMHVWRYCGSVQVAFYWCCCEQCRDSMQQMLELERHAAVSDVYNGMCLLHAEFSWKIASMALRVHQAVCIYRPTKALRTQLTELEIAFQSFNNTAFVLVVKHTPAGLANTTQKAIVSMVTCTSAI